MAAARTICPSFFSPLVGIHERTAPAVATGVAASPSSPPPWGTGAGLGQDSEAPAGLR